MSTRTETRKTAVTIGKGSVLLAEQRFYDDTYLIGDDTGSVMVFILDAALVRGPSGRERLRTDRDVLELPSVDAMVAAIQEGGWVEAPLDGNPRWRPEVAQLDWVHPFAEEKTE